MNHFLKDIKYEFDNFFEIEANEPLLFLLNSRNELDIIWGKKTERWLVGAFKNNCIYILNPKVYAQESSHQKDEFWETLKHEYCHFYYTKITGSHYPVWLNEGLASFLSGKKLVLSEERQEKLIYLFNYFDKADKDVYIIGQFWVEYLLKNYGREKFLKLIKSFEQIFNARQFNKNFYNIYGFKFTKDVFQKFLNKA